MGAERRREESGKGEGKGERSQIVRTYLGDPKISSLKITNCATIHNRFKCAPYANKKSHNLNTSGNGGVQAHNVNTLGKAYSSAPMPLLPRYSASLGSTIASTLSTSARPRCTPSIVDRTYPGHSRVTSRWKAAKASASLRAAYRKGAASTFMPCT